MPMARSERFKLKRILVDAIREDGSRWDLRTINMLLTEFGLRRVGISWERPGLEDVLADVDDDSLLELYATVMGVSPDDARGAAATIGTGGWKAGYARLFVSHSAKHKGFVGEVADELAVVGVHGFVAHDTMEYSKPWQAQIEGALRTMDAFVAIIHPEFGDSAWCQQEVGWALGRRVPRFAVRMGVDPVGFIGSDQWPSGYGQSAKDVASVITNWVTQLPELGESVTSGLFRALENAGNYFDAEAAASRISALGTLTEAQWDQLDAIYWKNDQVRGGILPTKVLKPFYERNGRSWRPQNRVGV